jgi:hypothetical protein
MTLASSARHTNVHFEMRAATELRLAPTGNTWVIGSCGHVLDCVPPWQVAGWQARIDQGKRHRRRCASCPKP